MDQCHAFEVVLLYQESVLVFFFSGEPSFFVKSDRFLPGEPSEPGMTANTNERKKKNEINRKINIFGKFAR